MQHIIRQIDTDRNYNKTLLKNRRSKKNDLISNKNHGLIFKKVSEKELEKIKFNIRKKIKKDKLKTNLFTLIFTCLFLILTYLLIFNQ